MEFVAAPDERWAKLAKRMHDPEHAGDGTSSVVDPEQCGPILLGSVAQAARIEWAFGVAASVALAGGFWTLSLRRMPTRSVALSRG